MKRRELRRSETKRVEESWDEERWGDESEDIFLVTLWRSLWTSSFTIWRWSRCSFALSSEAISLADTKLLCVECVAVSTIAPVCYIKELCRVDLSQRSVMDSLWYNHFVLCELEFLRVQIVYYVSYVGHNFEFRVLSPTKLYIIRLYIYICCF